MGISICSVGIDAGGIYQGPERRLPRDGSYYLSGVIVLRAALFLTLSTYAVLTSWVNGEDELVLTQHVSRITFCKTCVPPKI